MKGFMILKINIVWFFVALCACGLLPAEENFLLLDCSTGETLQESGPHIEERITPCSTFKIALSLMGFDAGILQDEEHPQWPLIKIYENICIKHCSHRDVNRAVVLTIRMPELRRQDPGGFLSQEQL